MRVSRLLAVLLCLAVTATAQTTIPIDDFEKPDDLQWHSGTKRPDGEKPLSIVKDDERGSNVLRARLVYDSKPIFITKTLSKLIPLYKSKSLSFWYKLSPQARELSRRKALVCRLRTSPISFTDHTVATAAEVKPDEWQQVHINLEHPKHVRNVYRSYFSTVKWITFRLDGEPGKRVEFEFRVDDVVLEMKEPQGLDYRPEIVDKDLTPPRRDVLIIKHSGTGYYNIDEVVKSLPIPTDQRVLLFRGLHFPIFRFPASRDELMRYSLVVLVDVDPYVIPMEHIQWLSDFVASGGGLLVCGGPNTFGHAMDFKKPLADLLPVGIVQRNDLADIRQEPKRGQPHAIASGIPPRLGTVSRAHLLKPKKGAAVLLETAPGTPPSWGMYSGGGSADGQVTSTEDAHGGRCAAELVTRDFYRDPKTGKPRYIALALIQGNSNGYTGPGAYPALGNTTYEFSFWLKGDVPSVEVQTIGWKSEKAARPERHYIKTTVGKIEPKPEWTQYRGSFRTTPDTRRMALAFRVSGNPETLTIGQKIAVDDVILCEAGSQKTVISNGDCEQGGPIPILAVGTFHKGRVAVLNTYPQVSSRLGGDFFTSDFYDDLMRQTIRWLVRAEPEIAIASFTPPPRHVALGDTAHAEIAVKLGAGQNAHVTCIPEDRDVDHKAAVLDPGDPSARFDMDTSAPGEQRLGVEVRDDDGRLLAMRTFDLTVHPPVEGEVRYRFGKRATAPGMRCTFRIIGKSWTKDGFTPPAKPIAPRAKLIDFAGEVVKEFPAKAMSAPGESLPFAEFAFAVPDLSTGRYRLAAELLDGDRVVSSAEDEMFVVDRLDVSSFYPIMSIIGRSREHQEDERAIRARTDDVIAHGFNVGAVGAARSFREWDDMPHHAVLRNFTEAYAQLSGLALIYEYQHYTTLQSKRPTKPCVHSRDYPEALKEHVEPYLAVASAVPRLISLKVVDEPFAGVKTMDYCDDCKRVWRERFGTEMPKKGEAIPKDDLVLRRQWIEFVRDYVVKAYTMGYDLKKQSGAPWDLLLTFCSPAYGYARDLAKSQEDLLWWSATTDRNDFDVYPYFYPVSDRIKFLQAHFCMALMRNVSQHLKKPWGFYVELDDRNYPMQINPVEASSECAMTAVAQGADYLNSFINVSFGTGVTARPERWAHLGKTLKQIRSVGPLLNVAKTPPARFAILFPYTHWQLSGDRWAPHYAHQLLLRAFGEADIIHEEVARRDGGFRCKALALLQTDYLPDDIAQAIVRFVKDGGLLLCDRKPQFNEKGEPCTLPAALFSDAGSGKGKAVLLDTELDEQFRQAVEDGETDEQRRLLARIKDLLFGHGVRPRVLADDPEFEIGLREAKDTIVLTAVNHGGTEAETSVTLFNPPFQIGHLIDATGTVHPIEAIGEGAWFRLKLKPRCGLILFAYPARPAQIKLDVLTPAAKRGDTLRYRFTAVDADGAPCRGRFLIPCRVLDPSGTVRRRYARAVQTENGVHEAAVPVAINAPHGSWRIEWSDKPDGERHTATFRVE